MHELPQRVDLSQARFLAPLLAVVALTATLILLRRRWPAGLAAWAHSVIVLAPVSGIIHSGNQLVGDRYGYLATLGLAILAGAGAVRALHHAAARPRWGGLRPLAWVSAALVVLTLGAAARTQSSIWKDSETLWRRAVQIDPACSLCESNLGRVMARPGRFPEAEAHVARAIALRPDRPGPHENLGMIKLAQGRAAEAEEHFRQAARLEPGRAVARNALGVALATQGRDHEAEVEFREAARLSPRLVDAPANLGILYLRRARFEEAIDPLRRAVALDGRRAGLRVDLGRALRGRAADLVRAGRTDEAAALWQEAAREDREAANLPVPAVGPGR
jgi:Flp pilus assembly protein TadD